jgi:hypothetical protein
MHYVLVTCPRQRSRGEDQKMVIGFGGGGSGFENRILTMMRYFLHWLSPGSQLDKVPRRPLLVSTTAYQNALPLFLLAQNDQGLM